MKWYPWTADFFKATKEEEEFDLQKAIRADCIIIYRPSTPECLGKVQILSQEGLDLTFLSLKPLGKTLIKRLSYTRGEGVQEAYFYLQYYLNGDYVVYSLLACLREKKISYECWKTTASGAVQVDTDNSGGLKKC